MPDFRPLVDCFETCDTIRAMHLLWEDFLMERTDLTKQSRTYKIGFYTLLHENVWKADRGKDENGYFGYGLRYIPNPNPQNP